MKKIITLCLALTFLQISYCQIQNFGVLQDLSKLNSVGIIESVQYSGWEVVTPTQSIDGENVLTVEKFLFKFEGEEQILKRNTKVFRSEGFQWIHTILISNDQRLKTRFLNTIPSYGYEKIKEDDYVVQYEDGYNTVRVSELVNVEDEFYSEFKKTGAFQVSISSKYYW